MNERDLWRIASTTMTQRQFQATILVFAEDLTYAAAARRMNIGERAVERLIARGILRIRHHVNDEQTTQPLAPRRARSRTPRTTPQRRPRDTTNHSNLAA